MESKMSAERCSRLISEMESQGWKCDVNTDDKLGFVFFEDENREWVRDYDKKTGRFVQFNAKQKINLVVNPNIPEAPINFSDVSKQMRINVDIRKKSELDDICLYCNFGDIAQEFGVKTECVLQCLAELAQEDKDENNGK